MKFLAFEPGRGVRPAYFEARSQLPVAAACVVANGVRETLSALLAAPLEVRLFEPVVPSPTAWQAIFAGALAYRVRGPASDAAVLLRPEDAGALAHAAFGEPGGGDRALSAVERRVVERAVAAVSGALAPVCGFSQMPALEACSGCSGFVSYFELELVGASCARIGIALTREPTAEVRATVRLEDLGDVEVELAVLLPAGERPAGLLCALEPGAVLAPVNLQRAQLRLGARTLLTGEAGARGGRAALRINQDFAHE
ncbi:MAG: hypothetical protein ACYDHD_07200 [Vulcanimicrobiaceae bacterium]